MSINCNWNGSGHVFSFPTLYHREAQHRVSYLAKYLAEEYSPCIYAHFTTTAVVIAESMEWDATLKKPISATETLCQDIENITFSWEIPDYSSLSTPASRPLVNLDKLTVPSQDNPVPAQPPLSTAVPTPALTPLIQDSPPVATTGSTQLLAQQLQAQVLAMSGTSPDKDTLMGTSMPTKDLLRILQSQVNSLLATRTHKPPVASFPQTPPEASLPWHPAIDNPPPAQPLLSMAVPTLTLALAVNGTSSNRVSNSTHLLVQQLQAQVLAMSGAPPSANAPLVGTSMSTKDLLHHLQLQVNSLSAAGIQQPMAAGTPQTPAMVSSPLGSVPMDLGRRE